MSSAPSAEPFGVRRSMASGNSPARVSLACSGEMPSFWAKSAIGPEPMTAAICSGEIAALPPLPIHEAATSPRPF